MSWRTCLLWRHRSIHFMCAGLRARTRNASAVSGICGRTSSNVPQEDTRRLGAAWWRQSRHPSADAPRQNHWFWADVRLLSSVDKHLVDVAPDGKLFRDSFGTFVTWAEYKVGISFHFGPHWIFFWLRRGGWSPLLLCPTSLFKSGIDLVTLSYISDAWLNCRIVRLSVLWLSRAFTHLARSYTCWNIES